MKVGKLSKLKIGLLTAALGSAVVASPITGGLSYAVAAPVAALTGVEIAAIITASMIGIAIIIALFRDYDAVSYENGKMTLKRKTK